jgi:hypothetical protein
MPLYKLIIMKKILLSAIVALSFSFSAIAQFTVSRADGTPVANGETLTFNSIVYAQSSLALKINNTSAGAINVRMVCQSLTNTDGQLMEVCFGPDCYATTSVNQVFPAINVSPVNIPVGGVDASSHFFNNDLGISTSVPVDYVFKIYQVNTFGSQIGTPFIFTYRYDATLSNNLVGQLSPKSVNLKSTTVNNYLDLEVNSKSNISIYDLNGRLVLVNNLDYGTQTLDVSNLTSGLYLINVVDEKGDTSSLKFIKK